MYNFTVLEMVEDLLSCGLLHQGFNPQELLPCLFLTPVVHSHYGISFLQLNQGLHQKQHGLLKIIALQKSKDISHVISKYFKISCLQCLFTLFNDLFIIP